MVVTAGPEGVGMTRPARRGGGAGSAGGGGAWKSARLSRGSTVPGVSSSGGVLLPRGIGRFGGGGGSAGRLRMSGVPRVGRSAWSSSVGQTLPGTGISGSAWVGMPRMRWVVRLSAGTVIGSPVKEEAQAPRPSSSASPAGRAQGPGLPGVLPRESWAIRPS
ncbi:hypothetical protein [Teichococcus aestuarii]|uniref:hypothetical protein n=1 Tax=Teichococcus aestuarii TaxID=568898 RepID=UPI003613A16F